MWPNGMSGDRRNALVNVFRTLASRWPKVFAADRTSELVPVWVVALEYVRTDVLEPAAVQFCASSTGSYAPSPPEFARFAKALQKQRAGTTDQPTAPAAPPAPDLPKEAERIDALGRWAHQRLGSWALVAEVWALLMETAPDPDHRASVRHGTVDREVFREAVAAVHAGRRAGRRGPLADVLGAA